MTQAAYHAMTHDADGNMFGFLIATQEQDNHEKQPHLTIWEKGYCDDDFLKVAPHFLKSTDPDSFLVIDPRGTGKAYKLTDIAKSFEKKGANIA